jgi:O-antigen ligase
MPTGLSGHSSNKDAWPRIFAGLMGAWLGVSLLKFGNPVILDRLVEPPDGFWEYVFSPWPVGWGYWMLAVLVLGGATMARFNSTAPRWLTVLPLIWFLWQLASAARSIDPRLTQATLFHFAACVTCFYLGLLTLSRVRRLNGFWVFVLLGFAWVLWMGFGQHFGGLESTREMIRQQPGWQQLPPEYLKRIASDRIFSTLVYPNALAGAILLFLPALLAVLFDMASPLNNVTRGVLVGLLAYAGLACLYWSGSKSGWLIELVCGLTALLRLPFRRQVKLAIVGLALLAGLAGFFVKFSEYFRHGATSVSARFDYWQAAWQITRAHPVFGSGPGTFSVPYRQLKAPESEMTRLVHNNFLEQASDSGVIGFIAFATFIIGSLTFLYRKSFVKPVRFCMWLGLFGWSLQGLVEFGLYIPATAWPAFLFFGWLMGAEFKSTRPD